MTSRSTPDLLGSLAVEVKHIRSGFLDGGIPDDLATAHDDRENLGLSRHSR
jgi:hypothetical protein